ncbi:MAG: dienelactone hydrolase family protein [Mariprofundales bacterium]|nr:dienelactone hydrolase family protein [Mariprofundales bacterium]
MSNTIPPTTLPTVICQTRDTISDAAVIWLHGLGADGHDFEPVVPELGLGDLAIRFIFPHAPAMPVTVNGGYIMPAWYDIRSTNIEAEPDSAGIAHSAAQIQLLVERELMRGIAPHRVILAGFSQGAVMALYCGMRQSPTIGGIIALSGYLALPIPQRNHHTMPIFAGHGIEDTLVPIKLGDSAQQQLTAAGYSVDWHSWPMGHAVCPEEIAMVGNWIRGRLT